MTELKTKTPGPRYSSPIKAADGTLWPSDGSTVCRWIENNCVYGEGDWYGQSVVLRTWQRRFLYRLYERHPDTNRRRYRRALLGVGKGNGKSQLAAWVGAYELLSAAHVSPRVIIGAASLKQANLVFGDLKTTITKSPTLNHLVEAYDLQLLLKGRPGVAERIAAEAGTNDGARATAFIADELHEWEGRVERVYLIVDGAIAKRKDAFTFAISTAGYDKDSLLYKLYDHGRKVGAGIEHDDAFLFEWYEAPDGEITDENWEDYVQAANPAFGDFNDPDSLKHRFATIAPFEFERYHLNRWTAGAEQWIPLERWDACGGATSIAPGDTCYVSVDGAAKRDTTAVEAVFPKDGKFHVLSAMFTPPEGEVMDPEIVEEHVRDLCRRYFVRVVIFNSALFFRSAQQLALEGYPMEEFPQSLPRMCGASQALYDAVMEGRVVHGSDPELRRHADAAVARDTGRGWRLDKAKATEPIDGLVALAAAIYYATSDETVGEPQVAVW